MCKNFCKLFLLFSLLIGFQNAGHCQQLLNQTMRTSELGGVLYKPTVIDTSLRYPLWIFMHGVGQRYPFDPYADGLLADLKAGFVPDYPVIIIAPQDSLYSPDFTTVKGLIDEALLRFPIDTNNIVLTGISGGGRGTLGLLTGWDTTTAKKIACMVVLSPQCVPPRVANDTASMDRLKLSKVPIYFVGGDQDASIGYQNFVNFVNAANYRVPNLITFVTRPGYGHCCWEEIYNNTWLDPSIDNVTQGKVNIWQWAKAHPRGSYNGLFNSPSSVVTVNAGANQSITLPTDSTVLNGSASSTNNATISSYTWSQLSGPNSTIISSTSSPTAKISGLIQGTYTYQLKAIDNNNNSATSSTQVIVNPAAGSQPSIKVEAETFSTGSNKTGAQTADGGTIIGMTANTTTPSWLDFSVTITTAGTYATSFRMGSPNTGTVQIKNAAGAVLGSFTLTNTGGWGVYKTITGPSITLPAGTQTIRIYSASTGLNFNWWTIN